MAEFSYDEMFDKMLDALEQYPTAVKVAITQAGDRLLDVVGIVHSNQAQIKTQKALAISELEPGYGQRWSMDRGRSAKRTYNTPGLLSALLNEWDGNLLSLVLHLQATDVLRFGWQWTKLEKFAYDLGVSLPKAPNEISDDDPKYLVGETWGDGSPKFDAVIEEEDGDNQEATP